MLSAINQIERNISEDNIIKDIRNHIKLKKKRYNTIVDKMIRDITFLYEADEENYYKPIRVVNAFSSIYIKYRSNGDKNKMLSIEEYPNEIKSYLNDTINDNKIQGE